MRFLPKSANRRPPGGVLLIEKDRQATMKLAAIAAEGIEAAVGWETTGGPEAAAALEREFTERLQDCSRLAFRVALGVLRNTADAEDVAQEAFVRAYRNFHRLRDRERFRAWLVRIAWRLAIDHRRSAIRRERRELVAMESPPAQTVEDIAASSEFQARLGRALGALPDKLRQVVILAAIEGQDMREVSELLGVPEGTVKSRLFKARRKLAEMLR